MSPGCVIWDNDSLTSCRLNSHPRGRSAGRGWKGATYRQTEARMDDFDGHRLRRDRHPFHSSSLVFRYAMPLRKRQSVWRMLRASLETETQRGDGRTVDAV